VLRVARGTCCPRPSDHGAVRWDSPTRSVKPGSGSVMTWAEGSVRSQRPVRPEGSVGPEIGATGDGGQVAGTERSIRTEGPISSERPIWSEGPTGAACARVRRPGGRRPAGVVVTGPRPGVLWLRALRLGALRLGALRPGRRRHGALRLGVLWLGCRDRRNGMGPVGQRRHQHRSEHTRDQTQERRPPGKAYVRGQPPPPPLSAGATGRGAPGWGQACAGPNRSLVTAWRRGRPGRPVLPDRVA
jgi:hypothetical protein